MMDIIYSGTYSWEDFKSFQALHCKNSSRRIVIIVMACIALLAAAASSVIIGQFYVFAVAAILILMLIPLSRFTQRRMWRGSRLNALDVSGVITPEHVTYVSRYSKGEASWSLYNRHICNDRMMILLQNQIGYFYPRSFFASDADWNAFVELVKSKVPAR